MSQTAEPTQADLASLKRTDITLSAVELRLNLDGWPAEADPKASHIADLRKAVDHASSAFVGFTATQTRNRMNGNLTPQGMFAADAEWADKFLGDVRTRRESLRTDRARTEENALQNLTTQLSAPPEDAHTIAIHREIRETLAKLPLDARKLKIQEWTMSGDNEAVRAVLTVPSYLTGLKPDDLAEVRQMVADRQDPERFARYRAYVAAANFAERALGGVIRYVEQETRADARLERARREDKARQDAARALAAAAPIVPTSDDHRPSRPD